MERDPRVDVEVGELVETLRSYGVLERGALLDHSGAAHWAGPSFEAALRRGVESGAIKSVGDDFFEVGDDPPEPHRPAEL
jgi:hypothetical protein